MLKPSRRLLQASILPSSRLSTSVSYIQLRHFAAPAVGVSTASQKHDDDTLRNVFDSPSFWRDFRGFRQSGTLPPSGLFANRYLTHAEGFISFSKESVEKCQRLVAKVIQASSVQERCLIPRLLDRLSDSLCRVLDMAEFVRSTHPDPDFQQASDQAYTMLFEFMNVLNTTPDLKTNLEGALADLQVSAKWSNEERMVAQILLRDFSKSAIDLPQEKRQAFVDFSNQINRLGTKFVKDMRPETHAINLSNRQLKDVDPLVFEYASARYLTGMAIPTTGPVAATTLRSMKDANARRELYIAGRIAPRTQLQTLQDFLQARAKVANLSGYSSYAKMNLVDKLAKSPVAVQFFLDALSRDNRAQIRQEMDEILVLKKLETNDAGVSTQVDAWDRDYYQAQQAEKQRSRSRRPDFMCAYFSLGTVMQGLSRLFTQLYGVRLVPVPIAFGEAWNPDVRRLDVIDETAGRIAILYCDFFARPAKSCNPAHFTLRCSRHIHPSELEEAATLHPELDPLQVVNDGMAVSHNPTTKEIYQLPTIALVCDFQANKSYQSAAEPTLLSFRDLQTLFHEMGHAIHSIIGRTAHQIVSGTRCATDFAELPSVLMEHFATDPFVLSLFARHWQTDAPLPYELVTERLAIDRKGQGMETEHQVILAVLDQAYHSDLPLYVPDGFDSTAVFHSIHDRYGSVREPRETSAQGFFGHLVEYGGTYYSYLFDRAIARRVWDVVFDGGRDGGAVKRERGERFREEVLKWGGSRDGWECLAGLLRDERLRAGGEEAMRLVGEWGVKD
ncbi:MAG: hypothetical protein Q9202_000731 [Teloschistes flavicans]